MQSIDHSNWIQPPIRLLNSLDRSAVATFGLGTFAGILAITMWQQWSLTFGHDPQLLLVTALVISVRFWLGQRWYLSKSTLVGNQSIASLVYCLAAWSILFPFWIDTLTTLTSLVPLPYLENELSKPIVYFSLALLGWAIPGMLWSAVFLHLGLTANERDASKRQTYAQLLCGVALGLALNSIVLPYWFGYFVPGAAVSLAGSAIAWYGTRRAKNRNHDVSIMATVLREDDQIATVTRSLMACLIGVLLSCNLRLANQLMPHSAFVFDAQLAGVALGTGLGLILATIGRGIRNRAVIGGLFAAVFSMLLFAFHSQLVSLSLWMNASFSIVSCLLIARFLLMVSLALPSGFFLVWIADQQSEDVDHRLVTWVTPFAFGLAIGMYLLIGVVSVVSTLISCCILMSVAVLILQTRRRPLATSSWRTFALVGCVLVAAGAMPVWSPQDHASRTAKLLYSTPAFLAYRSGWSIEQLPMLDDTRMIDSREGRTGPLTLWRGRVDELSLRDAGIPRGTVTRNANAIPQHPAEVLQSVLPLVLSDQPGRVLFLGLTSGVNLATSLCFPIREAVCIESDQSLVDVIRGPIKRETGYDPFEDDRVTLRRISPELALMFKTESTFDVILCSSAAASLAQGSPYFTCEFYRRAACRLAEHGIFCQRFEGIDFGPAPLQQVLKTIRREFRKTMAIETTTGELLLLASNSEEAFSVNDLEARLETSHVRKVLARSGLDWSAPLNLPAYDHDALGEICGESQNSVNSAVHGQLAAQSVLELMRWGNKPQEVQDVLTAIRTTEPIHLAQSANEPNKLAGESPGSRRSRLIEWMGPHASPGLIRRLGEIASQQKLVRERPDDHWWAYRRVLRKQLQENPRSAIQQIKAVDQKGVLHPEDLRRKNYFLTLSRAATVAKPTRDQIAAVETFLEPFDPLVSYFGRQETADLLARANEDPQQELIYRLHVIYFAPTVDASVRNVAKAIEAIVDHPETVPDDDARFDALNGLIQTLRIRWEVRQSGTDTSSKKILEDIDHSLLAVEKGVSMLDSLAVSAHVTDREWQIRRNVIERLMLRPLRTYRSHVELRKMRGEAAGRAAIEEANRDAEMDLDENADL